VTNYRVHPTAVVEDGADIGDGASVWHHAHVREGAVVGPGSIIGKNVYVDAGARVGARCKVQNNVSVYSGVVLEDDVFVGPSAVFTNDRFPRAFGAWEEAQTIVRRGASIGANATLRCGIELGELSLVAAGAVVTRSVRPNELVGGNPARTLGWVDVHGNVVSREQERPDDLRFGGIDEQEELS
jgi:UDP-2-acetamido-3-amino-2,3-dideoxy-glucuronate N-acetyltransferase